MDTPCLQRISQSQTGYSPCGLGSLQGRNMQGFAHLEDAGIKVLLLIGFCIWKIFEEPLKITGGKVGLSPAIFE